MNALHLVVATGVTGVVGLVLLQLIKYVLARNAPEFEIEQLFGNSRLMAASLAAVGLLIIGSSRSAARASGDLSLRSSAWIGAIQGLCMPFRGFSRSGATISTGLVMGVARRRAEEWPLLRARRWPSRAAANAPT